MTTAEKLTTIAENQQKVYDAGYADGVEAGAKSEYDRFWDEFQNKGGKASYYWAFYGDRFTDETYNPKYDIVCSNILEYDIRCNPLNRQLPCRVYVKQDKLIQHAEALGKFCSKIPCPCVQVRLENCCNLPSRENVPY